MPPHQTLKLDQAFFNWLPFGYGLGLEFFGEQVGFVVLPAVLPYILIRAIIFLRVLILFYKRAAGAVIVGVTHVGFSINFFS